jgi:hypothetical protein
VSRSDLLAVGLTLVGLTIGYLIGGPSGWIVAVLCLILGIGFLVAFHLKHDESFVDLPGDLAPDVLPTYPSFRFGQSIGLPLARIQIWAT